MNHSELERRLLFILHRGLVEARLPAQAHDHEQLFDLADALEPIPGYLDRWQDEYLDLIRLQLGSYRTKHPSPSFDYVRHLDIDPTPDRF
jgi:hypothetical protein